VRLNQLNSMRRLDHGARWEKIAARRRFDGVGFSVWKLEPKNDEEASKLEGPQLRIALRLEDVLSSLYRTDVGDGNARAKWRPHVSER
jgi:hypothetical protein